MIYQGTLLRVIDNSGARYGLCIKVLKKSPRSRACLGDRIIIVVKRAKPKKKVRKGQIHTALVVRDTQNYRRIDGSYLKFDEPACVILRKDGQPWQNAYWVLWPKNTTIRTLKNISIATIAL